MTEEVSLWCIPSNYFFLAISMSTTRPLSDGDGRAQWTKASKKLFCCQDGSDWSWWGRERPPKAPVSPSKKHQHVFSSFFFFQSAFGRRWEENTGMSSEVEREQKSGNRGSRFESCRVCLSHWVLAHSRWAPQWVEQRQRDWRIPPSWDPPPSLAHYHTHPEEGSNSVLRAFRAWVVSHPPNTNLWGEKDANCICLQDCK